MLFNQKCFNMRMITIEGLPPTLNIYYAGKHWSARKKDVDYWHELIHWHLLEAKIEKPLDYPIEVWVVEYCKRLRDSDSAVIAVKLFGDSLVKGGWLPDDSPKYIEAVHLTCKKANKNYLEIMF